MDADNILLQVAHEVVALEVMTLLLEKASDDRYALLLHLRKTHLLLLLVHHCAILYTACAMLTALSVHAAWR